MHLSINKIRSQYDNNVEIQIHCHTKMDENIEKSGLESISSFLFKYVAYWPCITLHHVENMLMNEFHLSATVLRTEK